VVERKRACDCLRGPGKLPASCFYYKKRTGNEGMMRLSLLTHTHQRKQSPACPGKEKESRSRARECAAAGGRRTKRRRGS
jgi:hypothetical protein